MAHPLVSVILPIYNIEQYLDRCMDSVLHQTWSELEILMVDDGSTDRCGALCDAYAALDDRIRVIHKENGGLSDARNCGIGQAGGDYITCIDPDDYVDPDYVEYLMDLILRHGTLMSVAQHRVIFENGRIEDHGAAPDSGETETVLSARDCIERMCYHDVIDTSAWAKMYHRSLFADVRYPKGRIFEDIATTYKLMMQCDRIAVGLASKYNYLFHSGSIVTGAFNPRKLDLLPMTDRMARDVLQRWPDLEDAVLRRRVYARLSTLNQLPAPSSAQDSAEVKEARDRILRFIKKYRHRILTDPRAPKRDKIALRMLGMGYPVYRAGWGLYAKVKKGK